MLSPHESSGHFVGAVPDLLIGGTRWNQCRIPLGAVDKQIFVEVSILPRSEVGNVRIARHPFARFVSR